MRIVSLVPSLTHMLCDLGRRAQIVGCTNFCTLPVGLHRGVTLVGGTKDADLALIASLRPTHLLVNSEENTPTLIAACQGMGDTMVTFPKSPSDVPVLLRAVGDWTDVAGAAEQAAIRLEAALASLEQTALIARAKQPPRRYLYYIWREPYMVAASDTYISATLSLANLVNAAPDEGRYPALTTGAATTCRPELIFLSSEPYSFRRRDAARLKAEWPTVPPIFRANGQLLSWYGTMTETALLALHAWLLGDEQDVFSSLS